jgi:tetratricopeptide (TPR) repeat protein
MSDKNSSILEQAEGLFRSGNFQKLIDFYEKLRPAEQKKLGAEEQNRLQFMAGWAYAQTGQFPKAAKLVKTLLKAETGELGVWHLAASVSAGMAEYDQTDKHASDYFQNFFAGRYSATFGIGPELRYEVYNLWGKALKELGRADEAGPVFKKGIEAKPDHPAAYLNLLHLFFQQKKLSEAAPVLTAGLKNLAEPEELYKLVGFYCAPSQAAPIYLKALGAAGKWAEMLKFLSKNPALEQNGWAKKFKAQALGGLGQWEEARFVSEQYLAAAPSDWEALNELGNACFHLGFFDRAEECYRKALAANPGWEEGWRSLSVSLSQAGKLDEARVSLEQYLSKVPEDKTVYGFFADLLYRGKEFGRAVNFYEDFLRYHPREKESWVKLADCYFNLGHPQSALSSYKQAQILAPDSDEIRSKIEHLNRQFPPET